MSAALSVAEREGVRRLTVARVLDHSRVTRKAFYEAFHDAEDCLHAGLEQVLAAAVREAAEAFRSAGSWQEAIRAGVHTLLVLAETRPRLARVIVVELAAGGPRLLELRAQLLARGAETIALGSQAPRARETTPLTPETLAGGVAQVLHERLRTGEDVKPTDLSAQLTAALVLPYLGAAAAARELALAPPAARTNGRLGLPREPRASSAFGIRMTDRTVKVLVAIAKEPGASNVRIAQAAGITDPGQVSKLLARLAARGVATKTQTPGGPNAWRLTALGREISAAAVGG